MASAHVGARGDAESTALDVDETAAFGADRDADVGEVAAGGAKGATGRARQEDGVRAAGDVAVEKLDLSVTCMSVTCRLHVGYIYVAVEKLDLSYFGDA